MCWKKEFTQPEIDEVVKDLEPNTPKGILDGGSITYNMSEDSVTIKGIPKQVWLTTVADTNSMLPLIDNGDIAILTNGFAHYHLGIGDIVVYEVGNTSIIHRIIDIQESNAGRVYTCKGDNNAGNDPYQILDEHINWLLVGVIYCKK